MLLRCSGRIISSVSIQSSDPITSCVRATLLSVLVFLCYAFSTFLAYVELILVELSVAVVERDTTRGLRRVMARECW